MEMYKVNSKFFYMIKGGKVYHNNEPAMDGNEIQSCFTPEEFRDYVKRTPGVIEPYNIKAAWRNVNIKELATALTLLAIASALLFI